MWYVEVFEIETEEVIKRVECSSERKAERVEDGILINLNWEDYDTRIIFEEIK